VFFAMLKPGDTIMGMSLAEGGHLTHGMALNMSGKWFNVVSYGLNAEDIDYDASWKSWPASTSPLIIAGASAYRCASTSSASPRSPRKSAPTSWWTWPTTPA
jgi:glycine hydroxymethyltransferase